MTLKIVEITDEKKGSSVNFVKTKILEGKTSKAPVGTKIKGILAKDISLGKPICIKKEGEDFYFATSEVMSISYPNPGNKLVIGTETSIYEMKRKKK
ncbi:MAG: hypothetical protein NTW62_01455 [Candidatus Nomurabacteria bacterium]|nr:hypothetical protein [Candidatus Nomurabacteria bacterium]